MLNFVLEIRRDIPLEHTFSHTLFLMGDLFRTHFLQFHTLICLQLFLDLLEDLGLSEAIGQTLLGDNHVSIFQGYF